MIGQDIVLHTDLDSETAELSGRVDLHVLPDIRRKEVRVRIKLLHHSAERAVDELFRFDLVVDVVRLDEMKNLLEHLQILIALIRRTRLGVAVAMLRDEVVAACACEVNSKICFVKPWPTVTPSQEMLRMRPRREAFFAILIMRS